MEKIFHDNSTTKLAIWFPKIEVIYDVYFGGKTQDNKANNSNNIDKISDDEDVPDVMDF